MLYLRARYSTRFLWLVLLLAATISTPSLVLASGFILSWQDNSTNEDGFKIERAINANYGEIASVGPNIQSYTDSGLLAGTTYCYRIRSFNTSGVSNPSNESCATIPITTFALGVTKSGSGGGTVTSSPVGISCGSDCSEVYPSGTVVSLAAAPASGSTFAGWSGDSDCLDGVVSMVANKTCTATFNTQVTTNYALTVNLSSMVSSEGTGSGSVNSNPAGINCGNDCSEAYSSGTVVSLTAVPSAGSLFAGWSGDSDCLDGVLTMGANKSCTATFKLDVATLNIVRSGNGTVNSNPAGIDCGTSCSKSFAKGTKVTLSAKAGADTQFAGWVGGGCQGVTDCTVSLADSTSVAATFVNVDSAIGIFRPATGEWLLDMNRNGIWEGCSVDLCFGPFGEDEDLPIAGDWTGTGLSNIGVFRRSTGQWLLDLNGNGQWDGCSIDRCLRSIGSQDSLPVVGDWTGSGTDRVGETVSGRTPKWYLDLNGDGTADSCSTDACLKFPNAQGDFPVSGDWNGNGKAKIGTFRPATGEWFLDLNGDGQWKNCKFDKCVKSFGVAGDQPIAGDWTGNGKATIGIYRSATGEWFLDSNGNGKWDGCGVDACFQFVGANAGDLPVVGRW